MKSKTYRIFTRYFTFINNAFFIFKFKKYTILIKTYVGKEQIFSNILLLKKYIYYLTCFYIRKARFNKEELWIIFRNNF